jgi:hypothetical protein
MGDAMLADPQVDLESSRLGCQPKAKITVEPYRRRKCALNALIFA